MASEKGATSGLSISDLANLAVSRLNPILDFRTNDLDDYATQQLRNDYIRDYGTIQGALNRATNAAYDVTRAQAIQDALKAEDTNYANTRQAISEMRRNLVGSASSGANVGAANATALQALLGLGQQNTQTTTEGLQNINNVGRERAAQLAQNAADAITAANDATSKMYDVATSAYASDRSYAAQGAAEALGQLASAVETNASQERQTAATNASNERQTEATNAANERMNTVTAEATKYAARKGQTQTIINRKK